MTHLKSSRPSNAMDDYPRGRPCTSELYLDLAFFSRMLRDVASAFKENEKVILNSIDGTRFICVFKQFRVILR